MSESRGLIDGFRSQGVTALVAVAACIAFRYWSAPPVALPPVVPPSAAAAGSVDGRDLPGAPPRQLPGVMVAQYLPPAAESPMSTAEKQFPFFQPRTPGGISPAEPKATAANPAAAASDAAGSAATGGTDPTAPALGPAATQSRDLSVVPAAAAPTSATASPDGASQPVSIQTVPRQTAPQQAAPPPVVPLPVQETLPVGDPNAADRIHVHVAGELVSITAQDAPLGTVLALLARHHGLNIVSPQTVTQTISLTLNDVPLDDALSAMLTVNGYTWAVQNNILFVTALDSKARGAPAVQGRVLKVFPLNYVSALDVDKVVKGLLSPVGQSFTLETNPADERKTQEKIVVEDLPSYMGRIEQYIHGVDFQPRQVVIEARILQVRLNDNMKHGINFERLIDVAQARITFATTGFANGDASPAGLIKIQGGDVNSVIEALNAQTDTKTLASPRLFILNGQKGRIQIGGQIGYLTSTSTMTSTVQTVNFLDTGVILEVTPLITADGQVLLTVKPQVSTGRINETTTLPESETTEVETRVMLADGEAVVIGGLINEKDVENENKLPWLGNIKYVGFLFRRKVYERERSEVIITLMPRIVGDAPGCRQPDPRPVLQTMTPLFDGALTPVDRTIWEPRFRGATNTRLAPRPPVVSYEPSDGQWMGPGPGYVPPGTPAGSSLQIYPPMPPLPSEEPIPAPPPVDLGSSGAAYIPQNGAENAGLELPLLQRPQGVPAQYVPSPEGPPAFGPPPLSPAPSAPAPIGVSQPAVIYPTAIPPRPATTPPATGVLSPRPLATPAAPAPLVPADSSIIPLPPLQ